MTKVFILSGFLGAGKTTLLKRMLAWQTDLSGTVVIVNDFGKVGIDGMLLQGYGPEVIELASGCICCTLAIDLIQTLKQVRKRLKPNRIIIESSGISDPEGILSALKAPELIGTMSLNKIITVLSADAWEAREVFGDVFFSQLQKADLILLNKIDLLDDGAVPVVLQEIHDVIPNAGVVPTLKCRIDPETVWMAPVSRKFDLKPIGFYQNSQASSPSGFGQGNSEKGVSRSAKVEKYTTFSYREETAFREDCFNRFIESLPKQLFRIKGSVRFPDRTVLLNYVGGRKEWAAWEGEPGTRLAFIGWNISESAVLSDMKQCLENTLQ
ncbi:MAG: GTP-binding protein [Deltaproteobacteria bacterium]|nr:GTP-binding protein [Deltaproteobacteria bacterium]